jgi:hypothetical protein
MKSGTSCRICGHWLEGDYNLAPRGAEGDAIREKAQREMEQGHCDHHDQSEHERTIGWRRMTRRRFGA